MAGEFLVGAVFDLDAAPAISALESIGRAFETIADLATSLQDRLATIGEAAFAGLGEAVGRATGMLNEQIAQVDRLAAAYDKVAAASGRAAGGSASAAEAGGIRGGERPGPTRRRADGLYGLPEHAIVPHDPEAFTRLDDGLTIPPPPRTGVTDFNHARDTPPPRTITDDLPVRNERLVDRHGAGGRNELAELAETAAGWEISSRALKQAGAVQQSIFGGVKAFNVDPESPEGKKIAVDLAQAMEDSAFGTAYPITRTAAGLPEMARPYGQEGVTGAENFVKIFPTAAKAAEGLELMDKKNKFDETLGAMIDISHQNREYTDPVKLKHQYDTLGAITSMIHGETFTAEAGAMSYVVPIARAAGASGERTEMYVGALQQAGLRGTIAPTTLRQELMGLTKTGGPIQAHLNVSEKREAKEFEDALKQKDPEAYKMVRGGKESDHVLAMKDTGLIDKKTGKDNFLFTKQDEAAGLGTVGGINLEKANAILAKWAAGKTPAEVAGEYFKLFGIRGEQAPAILAEVNPKYVSAFTKGVTDRVNTPGGFLESYRDQASKDLINQQAGQASARFADILTHIGQDTLPMFQGALEHAAVPLLNWLAKQTAPDAQGNFTKGQTIFDTATIGGAAGMLLGGIMGFFAGGVGAIPGALGGAAIGGAVGAGGGAAYSYWDKIKKFFDPEHSGGPFTTDATGRIPTMTVTPSGPSGSSGPAPITITIHNIMNGVADPATYQGLLDKFTASIKSALSTSTDQAHGSTVSPYTQGYGF